MTEVSFTVETNRDDLARNGLPAPDGWSLEDLVHADRLGLIYAFGLDRLNDTVRSTMIDKSALAAIGDEHAVLLFRAAAPGVMAIRPTTDAEHSLLDELTKAGLLREQEPSPTRWEDRHSPPTPSWTVTVHGDEMARHLARIELGIARLPASRVARAFDRSARDRTVEP